MLIDLQGMRGERPARHPRQLAHNEAQVAENVKLWRGIIEPWYAPLLVQATVNAGPIQSVYRYADIYWMHWASDVDIVRAPIAGVSRLYWTGDGAPKMGNVETIAGVTTVTTNAPGAQAFVLVNNSLAFNDGDSISIALDAGGTHDTTITTVQQSLGRLNLTAALPSQASAGNAVTKNSLAYPFASYPLGVPAPATAPTVAAVEGSNTGTIVGITSLFAEQSFSVSNSTATSAQVDLVIDSDGASIEFAITALFSTLIYGVQDKEIRVQVIRDPGTADEIIYEQRFQRTFQGTNAPDNQPVSGPAPTRLSWRLVDEVTTLTTLEGEFREIPTFIYTPDSASHTYRLLVEQDFDLATYAGVLGGNGATKIIYQLTLQGRVPEGLTVELNTAAHGLQEGDRVQLGGIVGTGTLSVLNGDPLEILEVDDTNPEFIRVSADAFGTYTSGGTWTQIWDDGDLEVRTYAYTYVATLDNHDMEGPPSPASVLVHAGDNQSVTVGGLVDPTTLGDGRPYSGMRVYRVATGNAVEEYLFVAEVAVDAGSYSDTVRGTALGEVLPSQYTQDGRIIRWEPPPSDLQGIIELPNGGLAGISGKNLCFAEPDQPHAWPPAYRHAMHDDIVGIAAFGASVIAGTKGRPVVATGTDPIRISEEHIEVMHPCESKRGMVDMGYAVLYPSLTGLVMASQGQADIVTSDLFTDNQWEDMLPSSFVAAKYGTRYMWFYNNGTEQGGYILDPKNPNATLARLALHVNEIWSDPRTDELYLVTVNASGNEEIVKWEGDRGGIRWRYRWRSKEFTSRYPISMSVVKVDATHYPVRVNTYMDGRAHATVEVFSENIERLSMLTDDALGRKWEVEIIGTTHVEAVYVAQTVEEIARYIGV